jgi:S1-C subfamily serine protease
MFDTIQIDARVNYGNSGGPVFDAETGDLIGILTMKYILL